MYTYKRCIGQITIFLKISKALYEREKVKIDSILKTYISVANSSEQSNIEHTYYIIDEKEASKDQYLFYSSCDTKQPEWFFILTSELEYFYAHVLKCTVIHGASMRVRGKSILLLGERYSGKTTLTKYLVEEKKGEYMDDDCIYIIDNNYYGFCFPLSMRGNKESVISADVIGQTQDEDDIIRILYETKKYCSVLPKIDVVVFVKYIRENSNRIVELSKAESFHKIMKNVRSHSNFKTMLSDIMHLISSARCCTLEYNCTETAYKLLCNNE